MKAKLITQFRNAFADGSVIEAVIWHVPAAVPPSQHTYKYRLAYVVDGERVVGFDNERGKGDHRHVGDKEFAYQFGSVDRLIDDFLQEVEKWKREH